MAACYHLADDIKRALGSLMCINSMSNGLSLYVQLVYCVCCTKYMDPGFSKVITKYFTFHALPPTVPTTYALLVRAHSYHPSCLYLPDLSRRSGSNILGGLFFSVSSKGHTRM